jgi:hypothetical protein
MDNLMPAIFSIVSTIVSGVLVFILQSQIKENRKLRKEKEENKAKKETALETGVRQLLSVRLEEIYDQYADSETIPRRSYDRWMKLHQAYKGLHGNGTFDHMKAELEEKHIKCA